MPQHCLTVRIEIIEMGTLKTKIIMPVDFLKKTKMNELKSFLLRIAERLKPGWRTVSQLGCGKDTKIELGIDNRRQITRRSMVDGQRRPYAIVEKTKLELCASNQVEN